MTEHPLGTRGIALISASAPHPPVWYGVCIFLRRDMTLEDIQLLGGQAKPPPRHQQRVEPGAAEKGTLNVSRILLPVDFIERSIEAAQWAVYLAGAFRSQVMLLHVHPPGAGYSAGQGGVRWAVDEILQKVPHQQLSSIGDPATSIIKQARKESAGLILMPTRGTRRWGGLLSGSVTARVVRHAPCPVWTITENVPRFSPIRNVLCALALAPRSARVLHWASQLADRFRARLTIVHSDARFAEMPPACDHLGLHAARKAWARQDLAALQRDAGTHAGVRLEAGDPERAVAEVARLMRADLLVIGRSSGFRLLGKLQTKAWDIACKAPCPVVIC